MHDEVDTAKLATPTRHQRANRSLREVVDELGPVSAATLRRIKAGERPDLPVFLRVYSWLRVHPGEFW